MITEPGIYDLPHDIYHQDPTPEPSLSAGMIGALLSAPAKCREESPRLNPEYERSDAEESKFSIGSVSHIMALEPHLFEQRVCVVRAFTKDGKPSDSWATQDAKDQRAAAVRAGKVPILAKNMDKVLRARDALAANAFVRRAFEGGQFEKSMFWKHPQYGFWCRARPDFIADSLAHLCDYKATGNADPADFGAHAARMGYHRRAAWYLEGMAILGGTRPDHYWFINQETKSPFLPSVVELDMNSIEAGQFENDRAAHIFAHCLESGEWYGYRNQADITTDTAFRVSLPPWAHMRADERNPI